MADDEKEPTGANEGNGARDRLGVEEEPTLTPEDEAALDRARARVLGGGGQGRRDDRETPRNKQK